jgi:NAD(P)-dependent dehydrogenase (short-subunit alcohol dehydrogenase family)
MAPPPSPLADGVDALLEWTIGGSFTRLGASLRRRLEHWTPLEGPLLQGKVVVMSGATSGLGLEAARAFARLGASLELIARNPVKAEATCAQLRAEHPGLDVHPLLADLGDLAGVRRVAAELLARRPAVHVLVHNAGALDDVRQVSPQGLEQTVASQVVGPFLLTGLLEGALKAGAPSRVLWVSSGGMYSEPLRVDHLELPAGHYDGTVAYARAKRAQVTLAELWAARLAPAGVAVHAMHPGWADTPGVERSLPTFRKVVGPLLRTAAEGADTLVWLAVDPAPLEGPSGRFWLDRRPRPVHRLASTRRADAPAERARLWAWAVEKSGWAPS